MPPNSRTPCCRPTAARRATPPGNPCRYPAGGWPRPRPGPWCGAHSWPRYCRSPPRAHRRPSSISREGSRTGWHPEYRRSPPPKLPSSRCKRKLRKFSVHGTARLQAASIQKETECREASEFDRGEPLNGRVQPLQIRPLLDPRQRQVRRIGSFLRLHSQPPCGLVGLRGQLRQSRRFHPAPEDARRARIRKEAHLPNSHLNRRPRLDRCESLLQLFQPLVRAPTPQNNFGVVVLTCVAARCTSLSTASR